MNTQNTYERLNRDCRLGLSDPTHDAITQALVIRRDRQRVLRDQAEAAGHTHEAGLHDELAEQYELELSLLAVK